MNNLIGLEAAELAQAIGGPSYRANQILEWIYAKNVLVFSEMTSLSKEFRAELADKFVLQLPEVVGKEQSRDGTTKYAMSVGGEIIEMVHMPEETRDTLCISSQAGCSFGCTFCVTARMNLRRNLNAGEIVGQVLLAIQNHGRPKRLNIVFMGMGEPLHNYDNVMKAFRLMTHPRGLAISARRITISTVGFVPGLQRMKDEKVIPNLAVSLNAGNNELRNELMPVNRTYPIEVLMKALLDLPLRHRQRITFEYVLLKGVNDSEKDARELAEVTRPIRSKINLIPLNPDAHLPYKRPSDETISAFAGILVDYGRDVAVRRSRGPDISAACGQLGTQHIDPARVPAALASTNGAIS